MSDHIDGPRSIGDPSIDTTDLFCFMSPENPARTVFAADVIRPIVATLQKVGLESLKKRFG